MFFDGRIETTNLGVFCQPLVSIRRESTAYSTNNLLFNQTVWWLEFN
jgi:hypothetical protein